MRSISLLGMGIMSVAFAGANTVFAHGFAGKRFFPATLATEDPFVADELSLPTIFYQKTDTSDDRPGTKETDFSIDVSKRITENFGVGFGARYKNVRVDQAESQRGFDNLAGSIKYKFYQSDEHETILSTGIDWDIGGSGSKRVGAESFSTVTPALFFGKGFGDLPDDMKFLRPLAVTGQIGVGVPTRSSTTWQPGGIRAPARLPDHAGVDRARGNRRFPGARCPAFWLGAALCALRRRLGCSSDTTRCHAQRRVER
jgi:hypothetical protein